MSSICKTQLLPTKILPPHYAPGLINRPRLLDLIGQVEAKQVTVIKAGPGFGKTSLAVAWAEQLQKSGKLIAWLTLDNDAMRSRRSRLSARSSHGEAVWSACRTASSGEDVEDIDCLAKEAYYETIISGPSQGFGREKPPAPVCRRRAL
jgi:hypothetical protein